MDITTVLNLIISALLLASMGIAGWAFKEVHKLRVDMARMQGVSEAQEKAYRDKFAGLNEWLAKIDGKLDNLAVEHRGRCEVG